MLKDIKETMARKLKEIRKIMYEQIENINEELEIMEKKPNRNSGAEKYNN